MQADCDGGGGRLVGRDEMGPFEDGAGAVDVGVCMTRYGEVASVCLCPF